MENVNIRMDKAYIAANKYIVKEICSEGAGVLVSYDEEIEKSETRRASSIYSKDIWFDILIPHKDYLLAMDKPLSEQSLVVRDSLLSNSALSFLFHSESQEMDINTKNYIAEIEPEKQLSVYNEEMKVFYDRKRSLLNDLDSGLSLMNLIVQQTVKNDIEVASAYLNMFGVLGSLYKDEKGERVIIYDPHKYLKLESRHVDRLEPSSSSVTR